MGMMIELLKRGASKEVAAKGAVAIFPEFDEQPTGRRFHKSVRKIRKRVAKASKKAEIGELEALFDSALAEIEELAVDHGETYQAGRIRRVREGAAGEETA